MLRLSWLLVNIFHLMACYFVARRVRPLGGPAQRCVDCAIIWTSVVTFASIVLGSVWRLAAVPLLIGVSTCDLVFLLLLASTRERVSRPEQTPACAPPELGWLKQPGSWPCLLIMSFWASHVAHNGLLRFPTDWDSLMYHMPMVDQWLQARSLYAPDCFHWGNPGNNEVLGLWMVAAFPGDYLMPLGNVPAVILLAFGVYELARQVGLTRLYSNLVVVSILSNFAVLYQATDAENDMMVAGLFLTCSLYLVKRIKSRCKADLLLFAASLGLLSGVKYYALGYAFLALISLGTTEWIVRGPVASMRACASSLAVVLPLGAYWYARNFWFSGDPIQPPAVLPRWSLWRSSFLGCGRPEVLPLALSAVWKLTGPSQLLAMVCLPLTLTWLDVAGFTLASRRAGRRIGLLRLFLCFSTAGAGCVYAVTPLTVEDESGSLNHLLWAYTPVRFGLPFFALALVSLAVTLQDLSRHLRRGRGPHGVLRRPRAPHAEPLTASGLRRARWHAVPSVAPAIFLSALTISQASARLSGEGGTHLALVAIAESSRLPILATAALLTGLAGVAGLAASRRSSPFFKNSIYMLLFITTMLISSALERRLAAHWERNFCAFYDEFLNVDLFERAGDLALRGPSPRACVVEYRRHYPFFGPFRNFRVSQIQNIASLESLKLRLAMGGFDLLAISVESGGGRRLLISDWIERLIARDAGSFSVLSESSDIKVYRFKGGAEAYDLRQGHRTMNR